MYKLIYVICDAGDGSQYLEWHRDTTLEALKLIGRSPECPERYFSGDGIQAHELCFPSKEALDAFLECNPYIYFDTED